MQGYNMHQFIRIIRNLIKNIAFYIKGVLYAILTLLNGERTNFDEKIHGDILLCGNGPSLSAIDLKSVKKDGIEIACVNYFPIKNHEFFTIKPKYLFLIDPWFFNGELGTNSSENKQLYEALNNVDWEMKVISLQGYDLPIQNEKITNEHISKYSLTGDSDFLDFLYRHDLVKTGALNVAVAALYYFISTVKGSIYLIGVDMSEFKQLKVDSNNNVYIDTIHNYGKRIESADSLINKGEFYILLGFYQGMFEQFYYLSKYALRRQVNVKNLAGESYLDMFEKTTIEKWMKQ